MTEIESVEQWYELADMLRKHGYRIWQLQYTPDHAKGFHVWFCRAGRPDVEIVTHSKEVYKAMSSYREK